MWRKKRGRKRSKRGKGLMVGVVMVRRWEESF